MSSRSLGTLTIDLVAKTAGFTAGLDKAERDSAKWKKKVSSNISSAAAISTKAIAATATAAATGLAVIIDRQRELIDTQLITAQSLNTTYASLANLERAGDLAGVGMETVEKASKQLALNIGKAIQGSDAQVEAFDRLGLSAQALYDLPLDERIAEINKALKANVQESERASVAAEIFGAKNAVALQLLDGDTIAEAARQARLFGTALSDIDASKVEQANDSISVISLAFDGLSKQLTVQLAPAIDAVGKMFLSAAEDAGGFGNIVEREVDDAVNGILFLMNAVDGIGRAFDFVANSIIVAFTKIDQAIVKSEKLALKVAGALGNTDYSKEIAAAEEKERILAGIREEARKEREKSIDDPLAGDKFREFWDDAKVASQQAAEAAVKARADAVKTGEVFDDQEEARKKAAEDAADAAIKTQEAITGEITALERAAKTWGMSADQVKLYDLQLKGANDSQIAQAKSLLDTVSALEDQKKATEDYINVVKYLRTEEEYRTDNLLEQLAAIDAVNDAGSGETKKRAIDEAFSEAPDSGNVGGAFSELFDVTQQSEDLQEWYDKQMEMLETFRSERSDLNAEWDEKELEIKKQHEEAMLQLEMQRWNAALNGVSSILGDIASTIDNDTKSGKEKAKKLAIAQAMINAYTAATGAYASASSIPVVGWILGPVAGAAALAAGLANVSKIKGQAHDGIMSVPSSGTWNLEKGERVTTAETSAKLDSTLERVQNSMRFSGTSSGSGRNVTVNQNITTQGVIDNRTSNQIAMDSQRKQRIAQARFS